MEDVGWDVVGAAEQATEEDAEQNVVEVVEWRHVFWLEILDIIDIYWGQQF